MNNNQLHINQNDNEDIEVIERDIINGLQELDGNLDLFNHTKALLKKNNRQSSRIYNGFEQAHVNCIEKSEQLSSLFKRIPLKDLDKFKVLFDDFQFISAQLKLALDDSRNIKIPSRILRSRSVSRTSSLSRSGSRRGSGSGSEYDDNNKKLTRALSASTLVTRNNKNRGRSRSRNFNLPELKVSRSSSPSPSHNRSASLHSMQMQSQIQKTEKKEEVDNFAQEKALIEKDLILLSQMFKQLNEIVNEQDEKSNLLDNIEIAKENVIQAEKELEQASNYYNKIRITKATTIGAVLGAAAFGGPTLLVYGGGMAVNVLASVVGASIGGLTAKTIVHRVVNKSNLVPDDAKDSKDSNDSEELLNPE